MKIVTSSRRQLVMAVLLGLAMVGAAMRYWAPDPSVTRDIGTLLLVLWLPAVGNLVGFAIRKVPARSRGPFAPNLFVQLAPVRQAAAIAQDARQCTVVIGNEGFTATAGEALAGMLAHADTQREIPLELLKPSLALPRLAPGTGFVLLVGNVAVAQGTVVRVASA